MSAKEAYGSVVCFVESDKPLLMAKSGIFFNFFLALLTLIAIGDRPSSRWSNRGPCTKRHSSEAHDKISAEKVFSP
jgi:hypothetical protein